MVKNKKESEWKETIRIHWRAVKNIQKICPKLFPVIVVSAMVSAVLPYLTIYFSARVINELAGACRPEVLLSEVLRTIGITAGTGILSCLLGRIKAFEENQFYHAAQNTLYFEKFLNMDFVDKEKQETFDLYTQTKQNAGWGGWGLNYVVMYVNNLIRNSIGMVSAAVLSFSLFTSKVPEGGGVLMLLNHPLSIVLLAVVVLLVMLLSGILTKTATKAWAGIAEEATFGNRVFSFFSFIGEMAKSKMDLRMYGQLQMAEDYMKKINVFGAGSKNAKISAKYGIYESASQGLMELLTGIVYVYVCLKALGGAFGIGSITQYVGAFVALVSNVETFLWILGHMMSNTQFLKLCYQFLDIPNGMYQGSLTTEKRADRQYEVEFKDVSFRYPGAENWALRHVNIKFKVGSRMAVVGENGSGKTTFIKLLCRLYDPQEGQILLNGIDIRKYNYKDYMEIFSVVFQDFRLLSQPLGANVAGGIQYDTKKVEKCLLDAGFAEGLKEFPKGLETFLYKDLEKEGIDVSGGEAQKIAIARALYKNAPFIILDEPTAALDPIAEAEIYSKFNEIVGDKTAIYISHRLSSCKFCDEITVFHEGNVVQRGSHAELAADENGKYYELWNAQAQYYVQEANA